MKKLFKLTIMLILVISLCGCSKDSMEDIDIYSSVYPIEYVSNYLYGKHSKIVGMYPSDVNPYTYKLTNKQIKNFSKADLIIYNGLDKEKDYIVDMLNQNKKLKIIDSTAKIEYTNSMDEIWFNPSNMITISQNIRDGLKEYITSSYLQDEIDENYEKLKLKLSTLDAEIKEIVENSSEKYIVIADNDLNVLSKYGFNIISIDEETLNEKALADAKELLNNGTCKYIFVSKGYNENETIKTLKETYDIEYSEIDMLNNISLDDKNEGKDYITIMNENIDKLKQELY